MRPEEPDTSTVGVIETDLGYMVIMAFAILAGIVVARFTRSATSVSGWQRVSILAAAFVGAMIGSKIPFVIAASLGSAEQWEAVLSGAIWFQNGKTILCGLAGGYLGVEIAKWSLDITAKTGDSFIVPVATSIAIGRLGCFEAGCCYGVPTNLPWAVVFQQVDQVARHPTQIYETLFHSSAAVIGFWMLKRKIAQGQLIKIYILCYALYRFATEFIRPEPSVMGGLTAYQIGAAIIATTMAVLWVVDARAIASGFDLEPEA